MTILSYNFCCLTRDDLCPKLSSSLHGKESVPFFFFFNLRLGTNGTWKSKELEYETHITIVIA